MKKWHWLIIIIGISYLVVGSFMIFSKDEEAKPKNHKNQTVINEDGKLEDILMEPKTTSEEEHDVDHSHDTPEDTFPPEIALLSFVAAAKEEKDADYISGLFNYEKVYEDTKGMGFDEVREYISKRSLEVTKGVESVNVVSLKKKEKDKVETASLKITISYNDGRPDKTTRVETIKLDENVYFLNQSLEEMNQIFQEEQK